MLKNVLKNYKGYETLTIIDANKHKVHYNGSYEGFFGIGNKVEFISWWKGLMAAQVVSKQTAGHENCTGSNIIVWVEFK